MGSERLIAPAADGRVITMPSVVDENIRQVRQRIVLREPEPEIKILSRVEGRPIPANGQYWLPAHRHRGLAEHTVPHEKTLPNLLGCQGIHGGWSNWLAVLVNQPQSRPDRRNLRMCAEISQLPLDTFRHGDVVGIHADHDGAPGTRKSAIAGRGNPFVHAMDDANPRVLCGNSLQQVSRAVGRAVIDNKEFEVAVGLAADAL